MSTETQINSPPIVEIIEEWFEQHACGLITRDECKAKCKASFADALASSRAENDRLTDRNQRLQGTAEKALAHSNRMAAERDAARADIERLTAALKPFAEAIRKYEEGLSPASIEHISNHAEILHRAGLFMPLTVGDFRRASAALASSSETPGNQRPLRRLQIAPRVGASITHVLKCAAGYFEQVRLGRKTAELRVNDRDFRVFDILRLEEFEYGQLTGEYELRQITHIVWDSNGPWLAPGHCMLSLGAAPPPLAPEGEGGSP